jgi:hypothetical protein
MAEHHKRDRFYAGGCSFNRITTHSCQDRAIPSSSEMTEGLDSYLVNVTRGASQHCHSFAWHCPAEFSCK